MKVKPLKVTQLRNCCKTNRFSFNNTKDLEVLDGVIEQERAVTSLKTGLAIDKRNYNVFVAGASGTGRTTIVRTIVKDRAKKRAVPQDWLYVHNFQKKENPIALSLPAGRGRVFAQEMDRIVEELKESLPTGFRDKGHQEEIQELVSSSLALEHEYFASLSEKAQEVGFAVKSTKTGLITIPKKEAKTLTNKEYEALSDKEKKTIEERRRLLEPFIHEFVSLTRDIEADTQEKIKKKQLRLARKIASQPIRRAKRRFGKFNGISDHLTAVRDHVVENLGKFVREEAQNSPPEFQELEFAEYGVNVVVDNSETEGAPVVVEPRPNYFNLFGKLEKKVENGVYFTDFSMIKAGSVLRANGGYLLINTNDLFAYPLVWDNLKTVLRYRETTIEDMGENLGYLATSGIRPQPIPIDLKVILIGPSNVFEMLHRYDEDFRKLFQVKSEFDYEMKRTPDSVDQYARFVATTCANEELRPVTGAGVGRIVEFGSRLVDAQNRVTLQFNQICNILIEADTIAAEQGDEQIDASHVQAAVDSREHRMSLLEEKVRDEILDHSVFIDTEGERTGAVNGIAVYEVGERLFGKPSRITAAVYAGKGGIINVERESNLSGQLHSKGVLIISGFLGALFGQTRALSLTVSLCFEQSYGHVDGDSASSAELYAILSSLADCPLKQGLAVTGSVNQQGDIQPVGGINEKIEGWFAVCKERGLTGDQGVLIPQSNVRNLMLKPDVVEAVRSGEFAIYPLTRVEQGVELLTGLKAGKRKPDFSFGPARSVLFKAHETLERFEEALAEGGEEE